METINFLAQLWGFSLIIISLAILIRPRYIDYIFELMADQKNVLIFGIANIILGVAFLLSYNVWDSSWKTIITILAWLITIRGIICLFFPNVIEKGLEKVKNRREWLSFGLVFFIIIGCILLYFGS